MFFAGVVVGCVGLFIVGWLYSKSEERKMKRRAEELVQVAEKVSSVADENKEKEVENNG